MLQPVNPTLVAELTADLEADDAVALAAELTRMIDLGLLELEPDGDGEHRVAIAEPERLARRC